MHKNTDGLCRTMTKQLALMFALPLICTYMRFSSSNHTDTEFDLPLRISQKIAILYVIHLNLIWQHTSCWLWFITLLHKYLITALFYVVTLHCFHTVYKTLILVTLKIGGPFVFDCHKTGHFHHIFFVFLTTQLLSENRWHGTLISRAKTSTKSNHKGYYCTVTQKIAYFSKSIRGQWSHSSCTKRNS